MTDKNIELTRRKVLGGITTVGVASAAAGAGTFALFSDSESTTDQTISTGTVDLNGSEPTVQSLTAEDLASTSTFSGKFETTYEGSLNGDIYLGMTITDDSDYDTDGDGTNEIDPLSTKVNLETGGDNVVTIGAKNDDGTIDGETDVMTKGESSGDSGTLPTEVANEINTSAELNNPNPDTLQSLSSQLKTDENDNPTFKYLTDVSENTTINIQLKCKISDLGNDYQGKELVLNLHIYAVETGQDPTYL
ncbi:TasA family protein [Halorientalis brevis]|uniref:TasA family protein n=1 Tax=Halorientalis brevis TaxID=1126241 RepID=A0ABD6CGD6_9EURY|nr:TasA family protein [Halorientalis brevis]